MKRDVYLSVDLDYWYKKDMGDGLDFIRDLIALKRPVTVFTQHHLVLKEIQKEYRQVYNIDYHSDIIGKFQGWPNCGCWANFVYGRQASEYIWCVPNRKDCIGMGGGLCHIPRREWVMENPFINGAIHTWKELTIQEGIDDLPLERVDRVSLILSPEWSVGKVIGSTLNHLVDEEYDGRVKFYGKKVRPTIKKMLKIGKPFDNWR